VQKTVKERQRSSVSEQVRASQPQWNSESIPAKLQQRQSTNGHSLSTGTSCINLDVWTLQVTDNVQQMWMMSAQHC